MVNDISSFFCNISGKFILDFIQVIIWPLTVIFLAWLFRKVVSYLFFSMDSFNFFGVKGKLKPIVSVIEEQAQLKIKSRDSEKRTKDLIELYKKAVPPEIIELINAKDAEIKRLNSLSINKSNLNLSDLVELFIGLDIIPLNKANEARAAVADSN